MGDQSWKKTQKVHLTLRARKIPQVHSPHHLTLERPEGAAVDPLTR